MNHIDITDKIMQIDTNTETFNMRDIKNRRFMYNPQTGILVLGVQSKANTMFYSHAQELHSAGIRDDYDSFIRGWIGTGKQYKSGVIHFAPNIPASVPSFFNKGFDTLEMFARNGAVGNTVIRGFGREWEQPLSSIIKEVDIMAETAKNADKKTRAEYQKEQLAEITKKLEQGIKDIFGSEQYKEYLSAMSKFHRYSFRNSLLIYLQKPDASMVAGYTSWQTKFKRQVKKGEKGIKIFSPALYKKVADVERKDEYGNAVIGSDGKPIKDKEEITVPAYKVATVFDVSQTEGEPIPSLGVDELTGDVENFQNFLDALEKVSPAPIAFENIKGGAKGYFNPSENRIAVQENMSEIQTLKTLIHEISHAKLHNIPLDKSAMLPPEERKDSHTKETEAESIAYTVCQHYGIDTSDYSFGYVAGWSSNKDMPELTASLTTIQKTAAEIINGIDAHFTELAKEQESELSNEFTELPADAAKEAEDIFNSAEPSEKSENKAAETVTAPKVKYYPINETAAKRANDANSFRDYKAGSATAAYREYVNEAVEIAEQQKKRVDPMYHDKIDALVDTYARKLAENMNKSYDIDGRVPSILIAGGSNFPTAKKEKQNAARDKNMQEWQDIQGLLDKIRSTGMGGISADDPDAVKKLEAKLEKLQGTQETMKAVNAYYRKHKTLDGCTDLKPEQIERLKSDMQSDWRSDPKPFEAWALSNNSAEIRRVKKRIEDLKSRSEKTFVGWEFNGGTVEANTDANRLQIHFDEKPDEMARAELKSNGFKWAPKAQVWQRQLNYNAYRAADYIKCIQPSDGSIPTHLQRQSDAEQVKNSSVDLPKDNSVDMPSAAADIPTNSSAGIQAPVTPVSEVPKYTPPEAPTVADLEQQVKKGENISLLDLAEASKREQAAEQPSKRVTLTADEKKIKEAVTDALKERIAYSNDGMLSKYKMSPQSERVMAEYNIKITNDTVTREGEPMFKIHRNYSSRKTQGCYRELNPKLEYIAAPQKKPSIRQQLNDAKSAPKKTAPQKAKEEISI